MVNISPLRATSRVTRSQTTNKSKAQDDNQGAAQGDSSATKSSNNINKKTAAAPLGAFELRGVIPPKSRTGLRSPSPLILLRCRQLQRFCEAFANGPAESRSKRVLVTPEHLARAHLAQPNFREKLTAAEADWEDTWVQNTKSLTGFLNSHSFKSLPLPEEGHEQQRKEAQEEEATHMQSNELHSPTTTGVQEVQGIASEFSKKSHGITHDTSNEPRDASHIGYDNLRSQQHQEERDKTGEKNPQQQQQKSDSEMSFWKRQPGSKLPESSLVSFASRPKSATSHSQGEDKNHTQLRQNQNQQQPVPQPHLQQPRVALLSEYSNGKSNTGTTADTSIDLVRSSSSPSKDQTSLLRPTDETMTGRSGSGSGNGSELECSPTQESHVKLLQRRVATDMEARTKASRAEKKMAMGTFEEKGTYTQQDWECFRLWKQAEAKRKAAKRTEKKGKVAATRDVPKNT